MNEHQRGQVRSSRKKSVHLHLRAFFDSAILLDMFNPVVTSLRGLQQASEFCEKALAVRARLAASAPENADYACDLWVSCWRMGSIDGDAGNYASA